MALSASPIARNDPLPPGVYWIDVFVPFTSAFFDPETVFRDWVSRSAPNVKLLRREQTDMIGPGFKAVFTHFFEVVGPVPPFPRTTIGPPRIVKLAAAPGGVTAADRAKTEADVRVTRPDSEPLPGLEDLKNPLDLLKQIEASGTVQALFPWLAIGALLFLLLRSTSERGERHAVH